MHFLLASPFREQAPDRARCEMLFAFAAKRRDLKVQITGGLLISLRDVIILLVLILAVIERIETGRYSGTFAPVMAEAHVLPPRLVPDPVPGTLGTWKSL